MKTLTPGKRPRRRRTIAISLPKTKEERPCRGKLPSLARSGVRPFFNFCGFLYFALVVAAGFVVFMGGGVSQIPTVVVSRVCVSSWALPTQVWAVPTKARGRGKRPR